jgi:hypothetical protein
MVFIDAGHTYQEAKQDILSWMPKVTPGGILSGHDYSDHFPGVKKAVDETLRNFDVQFEGTMWWVKIPGDESNGRAKLPGDN